MPYSTLHVGKTYPFSEWYFKPTWQINKKRLSARLQKWIAFCIINQATCQIYEELRDFMSCNLIRLSKRELFVIGPFS